MNRPLSPAEGRAAMLEAAGRKKGGKQAGKPLSVQRKPVGPPNPSPDKPGADTERISSHVQLPPPPIEAGPWAVGPFTLRRATAYEGTARLSLVGPVEGFNKLFEYLTKYKP